MDGFHGSAVPDGEMRAEGIRIRNGKMDLVTVFATEMKTEKCRVESHALLSKNIQTLYDICLQSVCPVQKCRVVLRFLPTFSVSRER